MKRLHLSISVLIYFGSNDIDPDQDDHRNIKKEIEVTILICHTSYDTDVGKTIIIDS